MLSPYDEKFDVKVILKRIELGLPCKRLKKRYEKKFEEIERRIQSYFELKALLTNPITAYSMF